MKRFLTALISVLLITAFVSSVSVNGLTDVSDIGKKDSLKILAIGNSFSEDATEYIPIIAKDCGIKNIVVGNMYIGGCTIEKHAENARTNAAAYKYYKNTSYSLMSVCPTTANVTLETALKDEQWDVITLQNSSVHSGQQSKYNEDLDYMIDYVKTMCPGAKLGWHMTWAYETGYDGSAFSTYYRNNELYMYKSILSCVQNKVVNNEKIDFIIPAGTAIQNARTSYLGDNLTRDGLHLTLDYGRYIVAATWMKCLGFSIDNFKTMPSRVRVRVMPFIKECVDNALAAPFEVTQSAYYYEPGTTPPATTPPETEAATLPETTEASVNEPQVTEATTDPGEGGEDTASIPEKEIPPAVYIVLCVVFAAAAVSVIMIVKKKKK